MPFNMQFSIQLYPAQQLYKDLFNSVSADHRNDTNSHEQRMGRIHMTLNNFGGLDTVDACLKLINDEEMNRPLDGTQQNLFHRVIFSELNEARQEFTNGFNMAPRM